MTVTKKDIADYLGISRTAVSLVLNNTPNSTISEETRNNILRAAKELGYRETEASPKICYILYNREPEDPLYRTDLRIIESAAGNHDYWLLFMTIRATAKDYKRLEKTLGNKEIEGVILSGDVDNKVVDILQHSGVPFVVFSSSERPGVNSVEPDVAQIAAECTRYLIEMGHRQIALFTGTLSKLVHRKTLEGYKAALKEAGIPYDKSLVQVSKEEDGYELVERMEVLEIPYTAAFCVNTFIQFGALQRLKDQGVHVPGQISLIGWGMTDLVKMSIPQLTTMYVDTGEKAIVVDRLVELIRGENPEPRTMYMKKVKLFEGGTTADCRVMV
jgi:LacI family transcriptional regulator